MYDSVSSKGSHPQLSAMENGNVLIVWDEPTRSTGKPNKQIGVEVRDPQGKTLARKFISGFEGEASYPVITAKGNSSIIAYIDKQEDKKFVKYQVLILE